MSDSDHIRDWERDLQELRTREGLETAVNLHPTNVDQIRLSPQVEEFLAEKGEVRSSTNSVGVVPCTDCTV